MEKELKYLKLLSSQFPNISEVTTEIINLEAIMALPKATEHFISDLHGEFEAVSHVLRNGSGNVKEKINEVFSGRLRTEQINQLATIIYYPKRKVENILGTITSQEKQEEFYRFTILALVELGQFVVSKYTRSKVRKAMDPDMSYIMEELLFKDSILSNKEPYYHNIVQNVIDLEAADLLIISLSELIQDLIVDHLHVVGDIYDRGPAPDKIIDLLMKKKSLDIQWGNHDVLWMGAASGSKVAIANVLRICARYDNLEVIEDTYGISLRALASFAERVYPKNDFKTFQPKLDDENTHFPEEDKQLASIQQAIAVLQFKLEYEVIKRNPAFEADDRLLLDKINYDNHTIMIDGKMYPLENVNFPTIHPKNPYELSEDEEWVINRLQYDFLNSQPLQRHISFLYSKGNMYTIYNDNLLIHGCIPLNEDGSFMAVDVNGKKYKGKALLDQFEEILRKAYLNRQEDETKNPALDYMWYMWQGVGSSLFGKTKMTTFERYYIEDKKTHYEPKNPYFTLREEKEIVENILEEFGIDPNKGRLINGHTPVKERKGEDPIKADGKLLVIDGGFSKAYQPTTGLAGYTLLYNSFGMQLVTHQPFTSVEDAVEREFDIVSTRRVVDQELKRMRVRETDVGCMLEEQVRDLKKLLHAYRSGKIAERVSNRNPKVQ